jgi:hypothetical protein
MKMKTLSLLVLSGFLAVSCAHGKKDCGSCSSGSCQKECCKKKEEGKTTECKECKKATCVDGACKKKS